jgi:hypothetical protein
MSAEKNQLNADLADLQEQVRLLKRDIESLFLQLAHREGNHGEASVAGCPFCPREMTADQLPRGS